MSKIKYVSSSGLTHYDEKIKKVIDEVDTSTNTKVTQTPTSTDASYPLLLSPSGQTQETNTTSYFNSGVVLNPSTKTISANIDGNAKTATEATSADKLNTNAGSATQPTYFADGIPKACTHTLEKSVPADAVFTDTKYKVRTRMTELGFTCGETYTVQQFFDTLYDKGISENILLYFIYDNSSAAKVSDGTTTIDMNGVSCYISVSNKHQTYAKHSAIVTNERKAYLLYKKHDGSVTPSSQGIIDLTSTVATSCTGNSATATKATQDASGNVITDTYAKKSIYGNTTVSMGRKADTTVGTNSVAIGTDVTASGSYSHAIGYKTTASGECAHAEGDSTITSGNSSHAEGYSTTASGYYSHAEGRYTTALTNQHAQGHYNNTTNATANSLNGTSDGTAFVIGNGSSGSKSNAFRITGKGVIYATNATVQTGADYAEYFEWSDGNPNEEDRVGYFVTFDEDNPEKIRIANEDDYILGIVSGMPNIIGNGDECWKQRYILDDFGRYIEETFEYEVEVPEVVEKEVEDEETGETKIVEEVVIHKETKTGTKWKENPEYDPTQPYIPRDKRAEWSAIGMLGVLSVRDDGTCQVNGYCKVADGGIATACEKGEGAYRVIKRISGNVVKVVLK